MCIQTLLITKWEQDSCRTTDQLRSTAGRKLNAAQHRYTTGKQELLSIVETLQATGIPEYPLWAKTDSTHRSQEYPVWQFV